MTEADPPPVLLDLEPDVLLLCLTHLKAFDVVHVAMTCKLFAILCAEHLSQTPFLASCVAPGIMEAYEKLQPECIAPPTVGILLSVETLIRGNGKPIGALSELTRSLPPIAHVLGCTTHRVVTTTDGHVHMAEPHTDSSTALQLGRFPEATVGSFALDFSTGPLSALELQHGSVPPSVNAAALVREALRSAPGRPLEPGWKVFVLMPCGEAVRLAELVINALQTAHPEAAIIGGIVTGDRLFRAHAGIVEVLENGVGALMFGGNVPLTALISRGVTPIGPAYRMTSTVPLASGASGENDDDDEPRWQGLERVRPVVSSSDDGAGADEPKEVHVLQAVREAMASLGPQANPLIGLSNDPASAGYTLGSVQELFDRETSTLRLDPTEIHDWQEGGHMRVFTLTQQALKEDVVEKLGHVEEMIRRENKELLGAVIFPCGGRGESAFGEPAFDANAFARRFGYASMIGIYAGGEIGPKALADAPPSRATQVGCASLQGFTAVYGLFTVPRRETRALDLAFPDAAAVDAAYTRMRTSPAVEAVSAAARTAAAAVAAATTLRRSVPELMEEMKGLSVKKIKRVMACLEMPFVPGLEKNDYLQSIAAADGADEVLRECACEEADVPIS